jgi:CRISPR-associated protein Csy1
VQNDPGFVDAWLLVGDIHRRKRETANALAAFAAAVRAAPDNVVARTTVAEMIAEAGGYDEARAEFRRISERVPNDLKAALSANLLLPQVYTSLEHLEDTRREFAAGLERLHEAAPRFAYPRAEAALDAARWTNFYLAYQGRDDRALQARYGELQRRILEPAVPELFAPRARRAAGRERIRVGFFSHFFFNCTAGRYFSSWITRLDRNRFEPFVYYTNEWGRRRHAHHRRRRAHVPHLRAARCMPSRSRSSRTISTSSSTRSSACIPRRSRWRDCASRRCSARDGGTRTRPASARSTGSSRARRWNPRGGEAHYSERLALLPGLGTRYAIPTAETTGSRADFGLPEDRTIYLVPQSLFKIHPDNDALDRARCSRAIPTAWRCSSPRPRRAHAAFAARLAAAFEAPHRHPRARDLPAPNIPHPTYLRLNELCDVMLDTLHWSGGNTSLDALASGLPVVTLPGELMRGRQSQAMLQALGARELVARDASVCRDRGRARAATASAARSRRRSSRPRRALRARRAGARPRGFPREGRFPRKAEARAPRRSSSRGSRRSATRSVRTKRRAAAPCAPPRRRGARCAPRGRTPPRRAAPCAG